MSETAARPRNQRGQGTRLRDEIVEGARALLERTGDPALVTLRGVAREVGIAAPSIYGHFDDRIAVLAAVRSAGFHVLAGAARGAADGAGPDCVDQLLAGCQAYLTFAQANPGAYGLMFGVAARALENDEGLAAGLASFQVLVDGVAACAAAGRSASTDAFGDATALWIGLHGLATVPFGRGPFPWPAEEAVFDALVGRLARLT